MARALQSLGNETLVTEAGARTLARLDLAVAVEVALQELYILVVDVVGVLCTEPTDFLTVEIGHYIESF